MHINNTDVALYFRSFYTVRSLKGTLISQGSNFCGNIFARWDHLFCLWVIERGPTHTSSLDRGPAHTEQK